MFVKMHKKRGKNKHIKHIHFSPFSRLFFPALPPSAAGLASRQSSTRETIPPPVGAHFFFSLIYSRVVYISFSLTSSHSVPLPFLPLPVRFRETISPPWILLPIFFSFLLLPGSGWRRWERLAAEEKK